jgi:L-rhamnonate dehydratase
MRYDEVAFAIAELAQSLAPHGVKWIEEFLQPDDYAGHAAVADALKSTDCMLATAEHEYSRWGYKQLIDDRLVDILQPDITWLGGITEARRVIAMASASNIQVIPHGSSVFSYHLALASVNVPMSE